MPNQHPDRSRALSLVMSLARHYPREAYASRPKIRMKRLSADTGASTLARLSAPELRVSGLLHLAFT
jgi:hypothetical protein